MYITPIFCRQIQRNGVYVTPFLLYVVASAMYAMLLEIKNKQIHPERSAHLLFIPRDLTGNDLLQELEDDIATESEG